MPLERQHCRFEDEVVLSFLDGEPAGDIAELAQHLEQCPRCARALEEGRKVDALLAAQTQTEIPEGDAGRLLDFLSEPAARSPEPIVLSSARPRWTRLAGAAAAVLLGVLALYLAGGPADSGDRERAEQPVVGSEAAGEKGPVAKETGNGSESRTAAAGPTSTEALAVPSGIRWKRRAEPAATFSRDQLLRAFAGHWVPRLSRARLESVATSLFAERTEHRCRGPLAAMVVVLPAEAADPSVGPVRESSSRNAGDELIVAATRWFLDEIAEGGLRPSKIRVPASALLAARGALRARLVEVFRVHRKLVGRRLARAMERRSRHSRSGDVALLGALGVPLHPLHPRRLAALPFAELRVAAMQARRTGDRASLDFLLAIHAAPRDERIANLSSGWFTDLSDGQRAILAELVAKRIATSASAPLRLRLGALEARLGVTNPPETLENP